MQIDVCYSISKWRLAHNTLHIEDPKAVVHASLMTPSEAAHRHQA
jgi:hypothetical protein